MPGNGWPVRRRPPLKPTNEITSSKNLYQWKLESLSLLPTKDDPQAPLQPTHLIPRPKVIKCDKTGKADRMNAKTDALIEDLHAATHIWLPIKIDGAAKTIEVPWRDSWDLAVFPD